MNTGGRSSYQTLHTNVGIASNQMTKYLAKLISRLNKSELIVDNTKDFTANPKLVLTSTYKQI